MPARFQSKVCINKHGCWIFSTLHSTGYGVFHYKRKKWYSHRLSYEIIIGEISNNYHIDHFRMNRGPREAPCSRACCNPEHLEAVTQAINIKRGNSGKYKRDITYCKQGHKYSEENTYVYTRKCGGLMRQCRTCTNKRRNELRLKNKKKQLP